MANYIKQSLEPGEQIVLKGRLHWSYITCYIFWALAFMIAAIVCFLLMPTFEGYIASAVLCVLALVIYGIGAVVRTRSEFAITNTRFIQKDGIFNIKMTEIPLFKVETVNFYQTLWQRILGTGCVELVGSGGTSHQVHCIEHPMTVRKTIVSAINKPEITNKSE